MKLRFLLPALGLLVLAAGAGPAGEPWKEYVWKDGKCSVLLPGKPTEAKTTLQVGLNKAIFMVLYADLPSLAKADEKEINKLLDSSRDELVKTLKGKLLADTPVKLGGSVGRELRLSLGGQSVYRTRLFVVGGRYYQLIVTGPREETRSKGAEKFFGSFKVLK